MNPKARQEQSMQCNKYWKAQILVKNTPGYFMHVVKKLGKSTRENARLKDHNHTHIRQNSSLHTSVKEVLARVTTLCPKLLEEKSLLQITSNFNDLTISPQREVYHWGFRFVYK